MNTTIYSISESPRAAGQIWVGTDDGNVQLTRDGGRNWTNVTANLGMPRATGSAGSKRAASTPPSPTSTDDRHAYGDMQPYLYRTADYGRTWQRLVGPGTPGVRGYAHVIKEDRLNPNILFLGTEFGLFMSLERRPVAGRSSSRTTSPTASPCATSRSRSARTIWCSRRTAAASG